MNGMNLNADQIDEMCNHFGFTHFPRSIGNPRQNFVYASESVLQSFKKWNGESSCFISTSGYSDLGFDPGGKQIPYRVIHTMTFFDFDHDTKPENAFADAQRLSQFLTEHNIAHWVQYSGSKGYHLFILHKPTRFKYDHRDGSAEALKTLLHQTQDHLRQTLGLNTLDIQTMGDPKRLCRFPFTKHIDRFGNASGRYARPIETDQLSQLGHDRIVDLSYSHEWNLPRIGGRKLTLREFVDEMKITLKPPETMIRPMVQSDVEFGDEEMETQRFLAALDLRCMGVVNEMKRMNPSHNARFFSAVFAKLMGLSQDQFEKIWVELGTKIGYVDLHNYEYRQYQMSTVFDKPTYHTFPNCTTLKAKGCCVGDICPKFKDMEVNPQKPKKRIRKWSKIRGE